MKRVASVLVLLVVAATGCIDSSRVNSTCTWADTVSRPLTIAERTDREHLRADAQLAGELGVRFADVRFRARSDLEGPMQEKCTTAMIDSIAQRHRLPRERVLEAQYDRTWWADFLVVYLPLAFIVAFCMTWITRRVCRSFDPEDRFLAAVSVSLIAPMVALLSLAAGQSWAFLMESLFLRNPHVAFRAFLIPITRHGWIGYSSLVALCAVVALVAFAKQPIRKRASPYAYLGRANPGGV